MKFEFSTDFQFDLLKFTVQDKNGYKAIELYDDSYFVLVEHSVIAFALKSYYKRKKVIPGKTVLIEEVNKTFNNKDFINNLTDEDRKTITTLTENLFKGFVKDGDEILESAERFTQFVDLKHEIETVNLLDYENYEVFSRKVQKAISPRIKAIEEMGSFLAKDIRYRQVRRKERNAIVPMPWKQLDRLTNAGGYSRGSIMVILDKAKKFKTGALINIALRYMKFQKKNVLIIDLDNGEDEITMRMEQSLANVTKRELLDEDGQYDIDIRKKLRMIKRQGGEIVTKRFPSLVTTANDIGSYMDYLYREFGFKTEILVIDYIAKMGCISGKDSLHERIGDAYIDISNLALTRDLDLVWTAQHVTRDAARARMSDVYLSTDVAGAIDITRHVQAIFGLNRSDKEEEGGYQRMEIVDQRDGPPSGNVVFKVDLERQRMVPLQGKEALERYHNVYRPKDTNDDDTSYEGNRKKKGGDLDA